MKTTLNLKGIQLGDLKIGDIVLEQEYNATEAINMMNAGKKFVKELIKDLPEMLLDLEGIYDTVQEIEERQCGVEEEPELDDIKMAMHQRACEHAFKGEEPQGIEELLADLRARRNAGMPKPKITVVGPKGVELPDEIKSIVGKIINDIENGELR